MKKQNDRKRLPSIIRWILWVVLVQFMLFNISAALYAYKFTHFYNQADENGGEENIFSKTWRLFSGSRISRSAIEDFPSFPYQNVKISHGNKVLHAWYSKTDSIAKGTVILFHGVTTNKGRVLPEAEEFRTTGYNVMLVDFRGHGNSSGNATSLGVREAQDVKLAYEHVSRNAGGDIILWGSSMGAVSITKAIADYNLKPSKVILEMPFATLQSHLQARARLSGFSGFPEKPFAFFVTGWMGIENGFNGYKHRTLSYARKVQMPVLLQWGAQDVSVLEWEINKIFDAIGTQDKKLVIYPTAAHQSMLQKDPMKWRIEVARFLSR